MTDPSHPEGQSPVQPTGVQCGECLGWHIAYTGEFCKRCGQPEGQDDREPARLRAQLSEKEAEIARMKDSQAADDQLRFPYLVKLLSETKLDVAERDAEIARLKAMNAEGSEDAGKLRANYVKACDQHAAQLAALRVERDEARAATQRANEGVAQARAAQAKAEQERDEALRVAFEGEGK